MRVDGVAEAHEAQPALTERIAEARRRREALTDGEVQPGRRGTAGSIQRPVRPKPPDTPEPDAPKAFGRFGAPLPMASFSEAGGRRRRRRPWPHALLGFALGAGIATLALSWPALQAVAPTATTQDPAPAIPEAPEAVAVAHPSPPLPGVAPELEVGREPPAPLSPPGPRRGAAADPVASAGATLPSPRANPHPDLFSFPLGRDALEKLEASLNLGRADRRDVQLRLRVAGFPPGPLDGAFGPRTRAAIEAWQKARGHHVSGLLNAASLRALQAETQEDVAAERRRLAALRAAAASSAEPQDRARPAQTSEDCARGETGRVIAGRSFRCDVVFLREDLARLLD